MSSDTLALRGTKAKSLSEESVIREVFGGRLFTDDFLAERLIQLANSESAYRIDDDEVSRLYDEVKAIFDKAPATYQLNEDETQEDFIYPILNILKWQDRAIKQNLGLLPKDLRLVPDGLLFLDKAAKAESRELQNQQTPYLFGKVVLENKKFRLPLEDREEHLSAPSMQILTYLNRAAILSNNKIHWGFLTNGAEWRLYYQKAQSVAEQFFSVRLDRLFADDSLLLQKEDKLACFKIFLLIFGKQAFQSIPPANYSFHQLAIDDVKFYQQKITKEITARIFDEVYEDLAIDIAKQDKRATGEEVKQASLKILYRILFILYAEDRELLPTSNKKYYDYSLQKLRIKLNEKTFTISKNSFSLWGIIKDLCRIIDNGDEDLGVPKYNGGLFDDDILLLENVKINDEVMIRILLLLSQDGTDYINYRNLNVEQLGSIYESLLEWDIARELGKPKITMSNYSRRNSGSYYTPEELVILVIKEATDTAYQKHIDAFEDEALALIDDEAKDDIEKGKALAEADAATAILNQKICDPAMGSGHFLVSLTDSLTDQVIKAMGEAENMSPEEWKYQSPIRKRIDEISKTIRDNAEKSKYEVKEDHLQDRHIIRRIVLKSCIYGVDKNPMAVELAKLSLWLHTFTVGAPLSFLDHHLKYGDSLFGLTMRNADKKIKTRAGSGGLFDDDKMRGIIDKAAEKMRGIANLTDSEIDQVKESEKIYKDIQERTKSLKKALSLIHASDWFKAFTAIQSEKAKKDLSEMKQATQMKEAEKMRLSLINQLLDGEFGNYLNILRDPDKNLIDNAIKEKRKIKELIKEAEALNEEENFFHWEVEFPEVWQYPNGDPRNGFDAIIGNPPWDRIKLEEKEWFADHDKDIAESKTQADRKIKIEKLKTSNSTLHAAYIKEKQVATARLHVARNAGIYQDLNKGDINIYKLFVERSRQLLSNDGFISLLMPSAIASDKMSADFFKNLVKNKQLKSFFDFQNRGAKYKDTETGKYKLRHFFKDVNPSIKFCIFTQATHEIAEKVECAYFLERVSDAVDPDRRFSMGYEDLKLVNPNTVTLPIFRNSRDKKLIDEIYRMHDILEPNIIDNSGTISNKAKNSAWEVQFYPMLHATNDSGLFADRAELAKSKCYPIDNNRYKNSEGIWLPLYKGASFHLHDHRRSHIIANPGKSHVTSKAIRNTLKQHQDPNYFSQPLYWVKENEKTAKVSQDWVLAFRDFSSADGERCFITAILPRAAYENTAPILINKNNDKSEYLLYANFSSIPFDFIARSKVHEMHMNWFIVRQLPVIFIDTYEQKKIGDKTAREVIREIILELVYTAHDLRGFAKDLGYVDDKGEVMPPYIWDESRRLSLCAKLDAIYFILYEITKDDDIEYIYSTFPKLDYQAKRLELCLKYKNALLNGECDIFYEALG